MTTVIKTAAPAKINLTFNITGTLPGGYHEVETLLQAIDLEDTLTFKLSPAERLSVSITANSLFPAQVFPCDESNLIYKAALLFTQEVAARQQLEKLLPVFAMQVHVDKVIPVCAGLAGGSADAAATLIALNAACDYVLSDLELHEIARKLGADVPFSLLGGTAIGIGRGDELTAMDAMEALFFCIVKPRRHSVSTPWAYKKYDEYKNPIKAHPTDIAARALRSGALEEAINAFGNGFEPVIFSHIPELVDLKRQLLDLGAWCCHLSGSGPALFAVVADREQARSLRRKILKNDDDGFDYHSSYTSFEFGPPLDFYIAESIDSGARITMFSKDGI